MTSEDYNRKMAEVCLCGHDHFNHGANGCHKDGCDCGTFEDRSHPPIMDDAERFIAEHIKVIHVR